MTFVFYESRTLQPLIAWVDGRLIGRQDRVRAILGRSKVLQGKHFGIKPLGPGSPTEHIKDPFAAYDFIQKYFASEGHTVTIRGDIPVPGKLPEKSFQ